MQASTLWWSARAEDTVLYSTYARDTCSKGRRDQSKVKLAKTGSAIKQKVVGIHELAAACLRPAFDLSPNSSPVTKACYLCNIMHACSCACASYIE